MGRLRVSAAGKKMHERFQERLELFLSEVKAHPEQFRGKVLRRRHNLLSVTEMADKKRPVASSIDSAVVAAVPRASSLPLERTRDCDVASAASAAVATAVVKAAVAAVVVGKDESQEVSSPPLRERSKSANAAGRSHSSKYVGNSNSVVVASAAPAPSPSAVPSDSAGPGLQMSIAPRGLPSRPSPSRGEAFSPPRRLGWVKMPSSTWLLHPEARDWLYEPDEGVYFHAPSETLWREEQHSLAVAAAAAAALAAEEACSHLRTSALSPQTTNLAAAEPRAAPPVMPPSLVAIHSRLGRVNTVGALSALVMTTWEGQQALHVRDCVWEREMRARYNQERIDFTILIPRHILRVLAFTSACAATLHSDSEGEGGHEFLLAS
eukprot:CAMPEP_0115334574 /NCGR_PEP_ID=MMETSP0270-20121206/87981_1 /TAXON_ID=71861 /ORGANISM="Scrippsiella trochoidea, Strain CCMP3099" /LENGTH=378 /DNA_ID=CAMNT_0002755561 /DNA_START=56 /DNA_END=1190 /DNA_ORIENTATION=-